MLSEDEYFGEYLGKILIPNPKMIALPLGEGTLLDAMDRVDQVDNMFAGDTVGIRYVGSRDDYRQTFSSMLQLLLYICSDEPDMPEIEHIDNKPVIVVEELKSPKGTLLIVEADRRFSEGDVIETEDGRILSVEEIPLMHISGRSDLVGLIVEPAEG